jgi:hypothetical protein
MASNPCAPGPKAGGAAGTTQGDTTSEATVVPVCEWPFMRLSVEFPHADDGQSTSRPRSARLSRQGSAPAASEL